MADVIIEVDYQALENARQAGNRLKEDLRVLQNMKLKLEMDATGLTKELNAVKKTIDDINAAMRNNKAEGKDNASNQEKLNKALKERAKIEDQIRQNKQKQGEFDVDIKKIKQQIDLNKELQEVEAKRIKEQEKHNKDVAKKQADELKEQEAAAKAAAKAEEELAKAEEEERKALEKADREAEIQRLKEEAAAAQELANALMGVANVFNTMGAISGGIADFSTGIANSFQSMASMFSDVSVTDTLKRLATKYITEAFAGDLSSAISRYDILSTFVPYMQAAGVDEQTANASLARVNESIIGIPIGLDEAAQRLRRYQMFLGDVESATNLTIGAQNAIIAGGASEQMKNMAYMQIDRLLAAGKLNTSRQWLSLIQGLGVSMNYVSQAMGTTNMTPKELAAGLTSGEISTESFLEALMELGKGESDAAAGLNNLLTIYKGTIEAWQASIRYASTRGQANVIDVLSDSLETLTGQGVTGYMKDYRDFINEVYGGIGSFISNNPELITTSLEKFNQLIESVSKFSASEFAMDVFSRLGEGVDLISRALEHIPAGKLEEFAAFATTVAGSIGSGMVASSGLGQLLGVFERFKNFDFGRLIDDIATEVERMASVVEILLGVIPDGLMSNLMAFGLVWGKPLAAVLTSIGSAITGIAKAVTAGSVAEAFGSGGFITGLAKLAMMHPQLAAVATGLTAIAGAMALFASAERQSVRQLSEDLGITDFVNEMKQIQSAMNSLDIRIGVREEDLAQTETAIRQAERLREALLELDSAEGEDFNAAKLAATAKELEAVLPGVDASIDATTGHLTEQARAVLEDADAFEQLIAKMREAAAAAALQGAMTDLYTAEYQRNVANEAVATASRNLLLAEYGLQRAKERAYKGQWSVTPDEGETILTVTEAQKQVDLYSEALDEAEVAAQQANDTYENVSNQVDSMTKRYEEAYNAVDHTTDALHEDADAADEVTAAYKSLVDAQKNLIKESDEAIQESTKNFAKALDPFSKITHPEGVSFSSDQTGVKSNNAWLQDFINDRKTVKEGIDQLSEIDLELPEGMTRQDVVQGLQAYYQHIMEGEPDEVMERVDQLAQMFSDGRWSELVEAAQNWKENQSLTAEATSTEENPDFIGELEQLYSQDRIDELKEQMETYHQQIREILESTSDYVKPFTGADGSAVFDALDKSGFSPEYAQKKIQGITQQMTDLGNQIAAAMQPIADAAQSVSQSTGEIGDAMGDLQDTTGEAADEVPANTEKMESDVSQDMSNMASNTDSSVNDTISSINELAPAIQSQILPVTVAAASLGSGLASGLEIGVSAAQNAASQIAAAAASIAAAVQEANAAAASLGTGGGSEPVGEAVLLATGGSVFSPFGSDTVPAMLTPGEYIIRKGAADFFGRGLLERINALDIGGAFDRLIINSPVTAGRYGGNVYNKDSHASVNQTFINSSPDYGRRRAMRFAHAL